MRCDVVVGDMSTKILILMLECSILQYRVLFCESKILISSDHVMFSYIIHAKSHIMNP